MHKHFPLQDCILYILHTRVYLEINAQMLPLWLFKSYTLGTNMYTIKIFTFRYKFWNVLLQWQHLYFYFWVQASCKWLWCLRCKCPKQDAASHWMAEKHTDIWASTGQNFLYFLFKSWKLDELPALRVNTNTLPFQVHECVCVHILWTIHFLMAMTQKWVTGQLSLTRKYLGKVLHYSPKSKR